MISAVFSRFSGGLRGGSVCGKHAFIQDQDGRPTHEQDIVVLWFCTEVLEDTLLPEALHVVPVLDLAMADRVVQGVGPERQHIAVGPVAHPPRLSAERQVVDSLRVGNGLVTDEEVQILNAPLTRQMTGLSRHRRRRPP